MRSQKKAREQATRQVTLAKQALNPEVIAKRTKRHLEDLERTNHSNSLLDDFDSDPESSSNIKSKFRARQTVISDKHSFGKSKKKSTMNVRTAVLYKRPLKTLLLESNIPDSEPSYFTATTPPSPYPPRLLCSVCGYKGIYKCKKCAMAYCDMNCGRAHDETRCERRVV